MAEDSLFMIQDFQKVTENPQSKTPTASNAVVNGNPQIKIQYQGGSTPRPSPKSQSDITQETIIIK